MRRSIVILFGCLALNCLVFGQTSTLSLASGTGTPGSSVTLNLTLSSQPGGEPAAAQWTVAYPASSITSVTAAIGPAMTAAGKALACNSLSGSYTCIASGMSSATISNGVVASITLMLAPTASNVSLALTNALAVLPNGTSSPITASGAAIASSMPTVPNVTVSSVACNPTSINSGATTTCTVTLSGPLPSGSTNIALGTSGSISTAPSSLIIATGATTATFTVTAGPCNANQTATVTASLNGSSQSAILSLLAPQPGPGLRCAPSTVVSGGATACTLTLLSAAPAGGAQVVLSGGNSALSIPASVTVPAGAATASFTATASGSTAKIVPVTAAWGGQSGTFPLAVVPYPATFTLLGNPAEISGMANGSVATPAVAPAGIAGSVVVNGSGSVNFAPDQNGNGVYFLNCCQNSGNAYYKFTGAAVGSIFDFNQGQIAFSLTSRSSFAQRALASSYRAVVDVRDGTASNHIVTFTTQVNSGNLVFSYSVGGVQQTYFVPKGTENALFGSGVVMQVALSWANHTLNLYLNGNLVKTSAYTPPVPNWTAASVFDVGAYEYLTYGGYDSSDDIIGTVSVTGKPAALSSLQCTPASVGGGFQSTCTATLSAAAPASGIPIAISANDAAVAVPASVTIPGGALSASFSASTFAVSATHAAVITAGYNGTSQSASLTVMAPGVSSLGCAPASVIGGSPSICTVTLSGVAPAVGAAVALASNNSAVTVPASVTIAPGAIAASFSASTTAVVTSQTAVVAASYAGTSQTASVLVAPPVISSLQCAPGSVVGGYPSTCTITLSGIAPVAGAAVTLAANNAAVTIPAVLTVPAGAMSNTFAAATGVVSSNQTVSLSASFGGVSQTASLTLLAITPSTLQCAPATVNAGSTTTCTVSITSPAPAAGVIVQLSSGNPNLTVPAKVTVAPGSLTAGFSANAAAVTADQTALVTASANGGSQSSLLTLSAPAQLTGLSCLPAKVASGNSATCTATLSKAPSTAAVVALSGGNALLSIPANVTVPTGVASATFTATASGTTTQVVALNASWNGITVPFSITVTPPPPVFSILGSPAELHGVANGSSITPTYAPSGVTGTVVVNGAGSVNFAANQNGNGVYFVGCCQNNNNAYYKFTGAGVGGIFNFAQGQMTFSLTSRSNMAQRALAASYRSVVDVRDGNNANHLVGFTTQVSSGSLVFYYNVGSQQQYYFVPKGTENTLFGTGVTLQVTLTWTGNTLNLYLNGTLVKSTSYTPPVGNWTAASLLDLGAHEYLNTGGYDSCDDVIAEFAVGRITQF